MGIICAHTVNATSFFRSGFYMASSDVTGERYRQIRRQSGGSAEMTLYQAWRKKKNWLCGKKKEKRCEARKTEEEKQDDNTAGPTYPMDQLTPVSPIGKSNVNIDVGYF